MSENIEEMRETIKASVRKFLEEQQAKGEFKPARTLPVKGANPLVVAVLKHARIEDVISIEDLPADGIYNCAMSLGCPEVTQDENDPTLYHFSMEGNVASKESSVDLKKWVAILKPHRCVNEGCEYEGLPVVMRSFECTISGKDGQLKGGPPTEKLRPMCPECLDRADPDGTVHYSFMKMIEDEDD